MTNTDNEKIESPSDTEEEHEHPSDSKYIQIAIILGVITALEVATYFFEDMPGEILIPLLMVMMVIKFFYVAAWFMHLRFDSQVFTKFFVGGLVLATVVYVIALTMFEFWNKG